MTQNKSTEEIEKNPDTANEAFDLILKSVGGYGKWQWRVAFTVTICGFFTALQNLGAIFLAALPNYRCVIPSLNVSETVFHDVRNFTTPIEINKDGQNDYSKCFYYDLDYSNVSNVDEAQNLFNSFNTKLKKTKCQSWNYDLNEHGSTLVTEWDLVCDRWYLKSMIQGTFMIGILSGAVIFSIISDRIGRRKAALLCTLLYFFSSASSGFSTNLETYQILRFISAAAGQGMYLISYTLIMEVISKDGRTILALLPGIWFVSGFCLLPWIAYYVKDWRHLQFIMGVPSFILFSYYWIFPESPRWLIMQRRFEEGMSIMKDIAKTNSRSVPPQEKLNLYFNLIAKESFKIEKKGRWKELSEITNNIWALVKTPNMRKRNCIIFLAWFIISAAYYGLVFSGHNLNVSIYLLISITSGFHIIQHFVKIPIYMKVGRRLSLSTSLIVSGLLLLTILIIPENYSWINIASTIIGRELIALSFTGVFLYSSELVPTNIRNLSTGIGSMWGRIGSSLAPFIVDFLGDIYFAIPSVIFGVIAIVSGTLCLLLPETNHANLPESIDEIEAMPR